MFRKILLTLEFLDEIIVDPLSSRQTVTLLKKKKCIWENGRKILLTSELYFILIWLTMNAESKVALLRVSL